MILASLLGMGAGFLLLAQTNSNIGLVGSGLLAGAGQGIFFPSVLTFSVRSVKSGDRGKITGIITGGVDAGMLIGPFSLGYLGDIFGFPVLFTVAAFCVLVGVFLFIFMRRMFSLIDCDILSFDPRDRSVLLEDCPRIGLLFKTEEFSQNKHSHIHDIASIIFCQF